LLVNKLTRPDKLNKLDKLTSYEKCILTTVLVAHARSNIVTNETFLQ
jgi:hypothetical protein